MKKYVIKVNGASYEVEVEEVGGANSGIPAYAAAPTAAPTATASAAPTATASAVTAPVRTQAAVTPTAAPTPVAVPVQHAAAPVAGSTSVTAPMPGIIMKVVVKVGDVVKYSQPVIVLEAMKMENDIVSPVDGKVLAIHTSQGASVNAGDLLVSVG